MKPKKTGYQKTLEFLKKYEGFKDTVYLDGNGIPTIGYGFTDPSLIKKGYISRADADKRLEQEVRTIEKELRSKVKGWENLADDSKTALLSYRFNYPAGFKDTTRFMLNWNAGDYSAAIREVDAGMNDENNPGLRERRLAEQALLNADPYLQGAKTQVTDNGKKMTFPRGYWDIPQYESTYQLPKQTNTIYPLNPNDRTVPSLDAWNGADSPSAGPNMPSLLKSMDERKRMFDLFSDNAIAVGKKKTLPNLRNVLDRKMEDYIAGIMGVPDVYEEPGYTYTPMMYSPMPVFADGKPKDGIIQYTKNGALYNVNKNVVGAKEISVTTPDVNVVGTDRRPMYQRYDAEHSTYDPNAIREFTDLAPVIGDIGYSLDAYNAFKNLDYLLAGILGGMVLMPNVLSYAGKRIVKSILNKMRFVDDGQKDLGVMLGTTIGGGIMGSQIADEDDKSAGFVVGSGAGNLLGAARGLTRSILRDSSNKVYLPYKMRPYMDWFLDPYETAVAKYHGYYGKTPTKLELYDTAYKHSLYVGADLKLAGNIAQEVVDNTNLLTEPEYILKNGTNSIGMYFPLENTIDVMLNRRNSLLPPKNVMGYNNPVLGTYSHEMNHYMNSNYKHAKDRLSMTGNFTDPITGESSKMYYIPNDLYFDKQFVENYKKALGDKWKKNNWIGSPEEMQSEIVNYLTQHDKNYMSLSKDQKNELFDLIARRFNMKKEDVVGLVDHIGSYHFSGVNK